MSAAARMHAESMIAERTKPCIVALWAVNPCIVGMLFYESAWVVREAGFAALSVFR
jgi:hypothetical protein